jgi:RHS repeat-associated protein
VVASYPTSTGAPIKNLYHSADGQVIEERWGSDPVGSAVKYQYVWSPAGVNTLVLRDEYASGALSQRLYVEQDANGNVTSLTNTGGSAAARFLYDPYGNVTFMNAAGTSPATPVSWDYTFQGGRRDLVTGRVSFGARDYIPFEGKWAQRDPLGLAAGNNVYQFVGGNPATYTDPTGLYIDKDDGRPASPKPTSRPGRPSDDGYSAGQELGNFLNYSGQNLSAAGEGFANGVMGAFGLAAEGVYSLYDVGQGLGYQLGLTDGVDPQSAAGRAYKSGGLSGMANGLYQGVWNGVSGTFHVVNGAIKDFYVNNDARGVSNLAGGIAADVVIGAGIAKLKGARSPARRVKGGCFAAGTPIRMAFGTKPIEDIRRDDLVLSRHESGPEAPLTTARVVQTFVRHANLVALTVGSRTIRTTAEHPFWVRGRGWTDVKDLVVGDHLLGRDGEWTVLSKIEDEQELATVYNFEVEELHTYFLGGDEWGFSVWAHNNTAECFNTGNAAPNNPLTRGSTDLDNLTHYRWQSPSGRDYDLLLDSQVSGRDLIVRDGHFMPASGNFDEARGVLGRSGLRQLGRDIGNYFGIDFIDIPNALGKLNGGRIGPGRYRVR